MAVELVEQVVKVLRAQIQVQPEGVRQRFASLPYLGHLPRQVILDRLVLLSGRVEAVGGQVVQRQVQPHGHQVRLQRQCVLVGADGVVKLAHQVVRPAQVPRQASVVAAGLLGGLVIVHGLLVLFEREMRVGPTVQGVGIAGRLVKRLTVSLNGIFRLALIGKPFATRIVLNRGLGTVRNGSAQRGADPDDCQHQYSGGSTGKHEPAPPFDSGGKAQ
jgi:hypothetical protein